MSLAAEGRMMLQALLDDLKSFPGRELILPLDRRYLDFCLPPHAQTVPLGASDDINGLMPELIAQADAVWPVAPETGGILAGLARQVRAGGKTLLLSEPETIALCANKLATYRRLQRYALPVVETLPLTGLSESPFQVSVIKPIDGVGCEGNRIVDDPAAFQGIVSNPEDYVLQPMVDGRAVSLSCLFKQGRGWLLCCNR